MSGRYVSGALVHGYPAVLLAGWLRPALQRAVSSGQLGGERAEELAETLRALERAADEWRASAHGSGGRAAAEALAGSPHDDDEQLDAAGAADLLGVSERRVRQLAEALGGHKVAGRWVFDRDELLAYRDERGVAA